MWSKRLQNVGRWNGKNRRRAGRVFAASSNFTNGFRCCERKECTPQNNFGIRKWKDRRAHWNADGDERFRLQQCSFGGHIERRSHVEASRFSLDRTRVSDDGSGCGKKWKKRRARSSVNTNIRSRTLGFSVDRKQSVRTILRVGVSRAQAVPLSSVYSNDKAYRKAQGTRSGA